MRWPWSAIRSNGELSISIAALDPATLEVIELVRDEPRARAGAEDGAVREARYAQRGSDPTGTAGIWRALEHS